MVGKKGLSGRPKGRKTLRSDKTQSNITMTPEAWAILAKKAKDLGVYKSDYIENLIRRGDTATYDMTIEFLHQLVLDLESDIMTLEASKVELQQKVTNIRKFLREIGVSPNIMP